MSVFKRIKLNTNQENITLRRGYPQKYDMFLMFLISQRESCHLLQTGPAF